MNTKALIKYYLDFNMFNLAFCIFCGLISSFMWCLILFSTVGMLVGYLGFKTFKNNEYYMYYNLGISKRFLITRVWITNLVITGPILILISIFF